MESLNPQVVAVTKLHILNPNEFDLWRMRIEQYFLMTDYSLWEVFLNGDSPPPTRIVDGVVQIVAPTTAKQMLAKKNKLKARGTLLMALHDKHQVKFNIHKDSKSLMEDIEKRFGDNKETKKVQKTLLKLQYENFSGTSSESLDPIHDRLQKLISQSEILTDLEEQSLDDLFNNLKIYEAIKDSSPSSQKIQNIAFVSSNNTDSTNESVNAAPSISAASSKAKVSNLPNVDSHSDVVIYSFFASKSNRSQLDNEDLKQIDPDDLEKMDLKWQMSMLTMRARRFLKRFRRNLGANGTDTIGFDMSKVKYYNCHRRCHFSRECRSPRVNGNKETTRRTVLAEVSTSNALVSQCSSSSSGLNNEVAPCSKVCSKAYATLQTHYDNLTVAFRKSQLNVLSYKTGLEDNALEELRKKFKKAKKERNDLKLTLDKFQTSSKNISKLLKSQVSDKTSLGFDSQVFNCQVSDCEEFYSHESDNRVPKNIENDRYKIGEGYHVVPPPYTGTFLPPKPDLVFTDDPNDSESVDNVFNVESNINKPSKDMSKTQRPDAPIVEDWIFDSKDEIEIESVPKQREPSFVTSTKHVKSSKESVKIVKHHKQAANLRTNNQKSRVLTRLRLVSLNAARPVPTAVTQSTVKSTWSVKQVVNKAHSPGNKGNAEKASSYWVWKPKCKVLDHVSRLISASITLIKFDYTDALGRSNYELMLSGLMKVAAVNLMLLVKKVNDDVQLRALIDGKKVVVLEAIIRRDLHLDDADGSNACRMLRFLRSFAKRNAWNEFSYSMASAVICLATCRKLNFSKYIFDSMVRNVDSLSEFLMYPRFLQVVLDHQVDDMTTHNTRYTSPAFTQKVFANMKRVRKGFSGVETHLFNSMLVQPQPQAKEGVEIPIVPAPPSTTKVAMDAESQGRLNQEVVDAGSKGVSAPKLVSAAEPTVFDDEDVTMTMAQTLIKLKAEKATILDE
nr:hypothetical protein [Tanacetum cinerariifolium]